MVLLVLLPDFLTVKLLILLHKCVVSSIIVIQKSTRMFALNTVSITITGIWASSRLLDGEQIDTQILLKDLHGDNYSVERWPMWVNKINKAPEEHM